MNSIIVYGRAGCGKTTNAEKIMKYYGLKVIVDDWSEGCSFPHEDALILTNDFPWRTEIRFKAHKFEDVMKAIG